MLEGLRRGDTAVSARRLRAIRGEVGAVDELLTGRRVLGRRREPDRDGHAKRLRRALRDEDARAHDVPDPFGDLNRLRRRRLGKQDAELVTAEARGHVVAAQLLAEDLGDTADDDVAGEVAV